MRFLERTLCEVYIAPIAAKEGALGGVKREFSGERIYARGSLQPATNTLNYAANALNLDARGLRAAQSVRLLVAKDVPIGPGDGVCMDGEEQPGWQCIAVETWAAHKAARLERIC